MPSTIGTAATSHDPYMCAPKSRVPTMMSTTSWSATVSAPPVTCDPRIWAGVTGVVRNRRSTLRARRSASPMAT